MPASCYETDINALSTTVETRNLCQQNRCQLSIADSDAHRRFYFSVKNTEALKEVITH